MFKFINSIFQRNDQKTKNSIIRPTQPEQPISFMLKKEGASNKFEPVSAEPFLNLALKSPLEAAQQLRERYSELSDFTNPNALPCICWDNVQGWSELANLLSSTDLVLAKTIYAQLLFVRNCSRENDQKETHAPDFDAIALELYNLENSYPDLRAEGKLATFSALMKGVPPKTFFWQECLERTFELAVAITTPEKNGCMLLIAQTLFYADDIPILKNHFSKWFSAQLDDPKFLANEPHPAWSKGYLFAKINNFCIKADANASRNISFFANSKAATNLILIEKFWEWFKQYEQNASYEALEMLQHAVHSDDKNLSIEASDVYIKSFAAIAKKDPFKASECLRNILRYSSSLFGNKGQRQEMHQNSNLCRIFDKTIVSLKAIDNNAAILVFYEFFMSSHGGPSHRMQNKYASEIAMALLHRQEKLHLQEN